MPITELIRHYDVSVPEGEIHHTFAPGAELKTNFDVVTDSATASIQARYIQAAREGKITWLRARRVAAGMDKQALARLAGVRTAEVARAEKLGQAKKMRLEVLEKIAKALYADVKDLF